MVTGVRWAIFGGRSVSRARGLFMFVVGAVCTAFFSPFGGAVYTWRGSLLGFCSLAFS